MTRLLIDEHIRADSSVARTYLVRDTDPSGAAIAIESDGAPRGVLPAAVVAHVIRRYARPLDDDLALADLAHVPRLDLGGGLALAVLHWRAAVDAAGRDWLILLAPGSPPLAALANGVAAALRHLIAPRPPA